ncbi:MAG: hypothetical protein ACQEP7_06350, partial [bacterium]
MSAGEEYNYLLAESLTRSGIVPGELLDRAREDLKGGSRGQRHTVLETSAGEIFLKQYHHGGLLAEEEDIYFKIPRRFLNELKAARLVYENLEATPRPLGIIFRETREGFVGYYLAEYE